MQKLEILPVNKTVVFYSPIEGDDVLVRTGTLTEGSCFYHSLLHAHSSQYVSMDAKERMAYVKKLRKSVSKLDKEGWEEQEGGRVASLGFQEALSELIDGFYSKNKSVLKKHLMGSEEDRVSYQLMIDLLPLKEWEQRILPEALKLDRTPTQLSKLVEAVALKRYGAILAEFGSELDATRSKYMLKKLKQFIRSACVIAIDTTYEKYVADLEDVTESVDQNSIGLISDRFSRDVYFLDSKNRLPYQIGGDSNIKNRKSVIVMWVKECHYEVVGRLLPGNRVQREFSPSDPLIKRIHAFLFEPETVASKYPALAPYLPKNVKGPKPKRSPASESESESESEERPEYSPSPARRSKSPEGSVIADSDDDSDLSE